MASSFLQSICCCCWRTEPQVDPVYDETSRLIPEEPSTDYHSSNVRLVDHQRLNERLSKIVRAKEGKMVNVTSKIPFNIHNREIPIEKSQSVSRSASRSSDDSYLLHASHHQQRNRPSYHANYLYSNPQTSVSSMSFGPEAGPSSGTQSLTLEHPRPTPILVRLVGHTDTMSRGRTKERGTQPTGLPSPGVGSHGTFGGTPLGDGESTPMAIPRPPQEYIIKFQDTGPLTMSWND